MKKFARHAAALVMLALFLTLFAGAEGSLPLVAENIELTTYRGVSVGGKFAAAGADEGKELSYEIVTPPGKGEIKIGEEGCFIYTPNEGRKGKDYFGYKAYDSSGNCSQEATVIVRILKQKTNIRYKDMKGKASEAAAAALAENEIFIGENLAGSYIFSPETPVKRGEFLSMCMKLAGTELLDGALQTGFADDAEIETWVKPYVSTALHCGYISGCRDQAETLFQANRNITVNEATVMLDRVLGLSDVPVSWQVDRETVPAWACQATANLEACNVLPLREIQGGEVLNREAAADMLAAAGRLLKDR